MNPQPEDPPVVSRLAPTGWLAIVGVVRQRSGANDMKVSG